MHVNLSFVPEKLGVFHQTNLCLWVDRWTDRQTNSTAPSGMRNTCILKFQDLGQTVFEFQRN